MAFKKKDGSTKKPTLTKTFIKLDDLPTYLRERFDAYKLSPQSLEWALKVAAGENPMTATSEIYSLEDDRAQIKRKTNDNLGNPKMQQIVRVLRDNLKHETYIDANLILRRFDMLYSEALYDNNPVIAIQVLKEMAKIIKDNSGSITVTDVSIKFELKNSLNFKKKEIEAEDIEPIEDGN